MTLGSARSRMVRLLGTAAVVVLALVAGASAQVSVHRACAPPRGGRASCAAVEVEPAPAGARADAPLGEGQQRSPGRDSGRENCQQELPIYGCVGRRPADLHSAYNLPTSAPTHQTIALVGRLRRPHRGKRPEALRRGISPARLHVREPLLQEDQRRRRQEAAPGSKRRMGDWRSPSTSRSRTPSASATAGSCWSRRSPPATPISKRPRTAPSRKGRRRSPTPGTDASR